MPLPSRSKGRGVKSVDQLRSLLGKVACQGESEVVGTSLFLDIKAGVPILRVPKQAHFLFKGRAKSHEALLVGGLSCKFFTSPIHDLVSAYAGHLT